MMRMKGCFLGAAVLLGACAGADIPAEETHQPPSKRVAPGWATGFACDLVDIPVKETTSP